MLRISPAQLEALDRLSRITDPFDGSAYSLRTSIATLDALANKGLVRCTTRGHLGTTFSPRASILYEITDAGREALTHQQ